MPRALREEICPGCGGLNTLCAHPDYDGDSCPDKRDCCDVPCPHIVTCPTCKGEGCVTFAAMNRYIQKHAAIQWGVGPGKKKRAGKSKPGSV